MPQTHREQLTFLMGPVQEPDGEVQEYFGVFVPEEAGPQVRAQAEQVLAEVVDRSNDPTMPPKVRDGWAVRPAAEVPEVAAEVVRSRLPGVSIEVHKRPVQLNMLQRLVGRFAVSPPPTPHIDRDDIQHPDLRWRSRPTPTVIHSPYGDISIIR